MIKRKQIKWAIMAMVILVVAAGSWLGAIRAELPQDTTPQTGVEVVLCGPYEVVRVVDGDTLVVDIAGSDTKVRLIGIDTPESVHPDAEKNTEAGIAASEYTKSLLEDTSVYLDDGKIMLNRLLLEAGQAITMTIQPNSKYAEEFAKLQQAARVAGVGIWGNKEIK